MELRQNSQFRAYVQAVCGQIRWREVHGEVARELETHVEETAREYLEQGLETEAAIAKALERMGDAAVVGADLNKVHRPKPDWLLVGLTIMLAGIGFLIAQVWDLGVTNWLFICIGLGLAVGLYFFDYRLLKPYSHYLFAGTCLVLVYIIATNSFPGMNRWATNFVYFSPLLLLISLAGIFENWQWQRTNKYLLGLTMLILPLVLLLFTPRFEGAFIFGSVFLLLMFVSGAKLWQLILPAGLGIGFAVFSMFGSAYRVNRLLVLIEPARDSQGYGWLPMQLDAMRERAGLFGQGLGREQWMAPVFDETVLTNIIYAFGWLAGIALLVVTSLFIFRTATIGLETRDQYGKFVVASITTIFAVQLAVNIVEISGVVSYIGFSLPFIGLGGVEFIVNMAWSAW